MIRRGTYVLAITLGAGSDIRVGALGTLHFSEGVYVYAGSAMGGLDQRISRHIRREKSPRWHADYLTAVADSVEAFESYPDSIPECRLASMAEECGMIPVDGFGCSDCGCRAHLFRSSPEQLTRLIASARLEPFRDRRNEI